MKTTKEIKENFLTLLNNVLENADESIISRTEGRNKVELKKDYERFYNLFLEMPEKRQKNLSNKMNRLESYLS